MSDSEIQRLLRRLAALPEPGMREAVLAEQLRSRPTEEAVSLAGEIVRRAPNGRPYDVALLALSGLLDAGRISYDERRELHAIARQRDDILLVRLLLSPKDAPLGVPQPVALPGRPDITLGERKSLARTRDRQLIDRLLHDPDPSVLTILLGNPYLTEADAIRVAARRPTTPEAQRILFRSQRFRVRYAVRKALILNPYTPTDMAAQLVGLLTVPDVKQVERDAQLSDAVRAAARAQLAVLALQRAEARSSAGKSDD